MIFNYELVVETRFIITADNDVEANYCANSIIQSLREVGVQRTSGSQATATRAVIPKITSLKETTKREPTEVAR